MTRPGSWRDLVHGVGTGVGTAFGNRFFGNGSNTETKKLRSAPFPITGENDAKGLYRYKRMPRWKRKPWRRFKKKVQHVVSGMMGSKFTIIRRTVRGTITPNAQGVFITHNAMSLNGTDQSFRDLSYLFTSADTTNPESENKRSMKLIVSGWLCETQIRNTHESNTCYVDMYYYRFKKAVPAGQGNPYDIWLNAATNDVDPVTGNPKPLPAAYGMTPYQTPGFGQMIRIWKKVRVKIAPGGVAQVETRSGKNYYRQWTTDEEYCGDKCTEGIMFVVYGAVTNGAAPEYSGPASVQFSTNVNYTWKYVENNIYNAEMHSFA